MGLNITCPLPTDLPLLSNADCAFDFGQIVRLAFQRSSASTFADEAAFALGSNWTTAVTTPASIQLTPFVNNVVIPQGEAATIGPDTNETIFGTLQVVGKNSITIAGRFQGLTPAIKKELDAFISEGNTFGALGVFLIDEFGKAYGSQPLGAATAVSGIPLSSFFVGDPGSEGFNTLTYTPFQFNLRGGWFDDIVAAAPTGIDLILAQNIVV
jgi:hypothetical protein